MRQPAPRRRRSVRPAVVLGVIVAALLLVFGPSIWRNVFAIRNIEVQGNSYCTRDEVIHYSGIRMGDSILSVDAERVKAGINQNRYLEFVGIWRNFFPSSVIITVTEHTPRAKLNWMGMLLLIGDNGVVLERTPEIDIPVHVPEVVGMLVDKVAVGQEVTYGVAGQGDAIIGILDALDLQGVTGEIAEINITSPDNLMLVTEGGLQVILGDDNMLAEKIALLREVLPRIQTLGDVSGGILNISSGESADYRARQ